MAVHQTRAHIEARDGYIVDNPAVGPTLTAAYWQPGNSEPFLGLVERLTGSPLTAGDWVGALEKGLDEVRRYRPLQGWRRCAAPPETATRGRRPRTGLCSCLQPPASAYNCLQPPVAASARSWWRRNVRRTTRWRRRSTRRRRRRARSSWTCACASSTETRCVATQTASSHAVAEPLVRIDAARRPLQVIADTDTEGSFRKTCAKFESFVQVRRAAMHEATEYGAWITLAVSSPPPKACASPVAAGAYRRVSHVHVLRGARGCPTCVPSPRHCFVRLRRRSTSAGLHIAHTRGARVLVGSPCRNPRKGSHLT